MGDKGGGVGLTTLPLSCADCLEIWEPQTPGTLRGCPGLYLDILFFFLNIFDYIRSVANVCSSIYFIFLRQKEYCCRAVSPNGKGLT
jgi:hypothetical protein